MKKSYFAYLITLAVAALTLSGCGGGGGGSTSSPPPPPAISVTASKAVAFNKPVTDSIGITASLSSIAPSNTTVNFTATNGATIPATGVVTAGSNSVTVNIASNTVGVSTVIASASGYSSGTKSVRFVDVATAPDKAEVNVAAKVPLTDIILFAPTIGVNFTVTNSATLNALMPAVLLNEALAAFNTATLSQTPPPIDISFTPVPPGPFTANADATVSVINAKAKTPLVILSVAANSPFIKLFYDLTIVNAVPSFGIVGGPTLGIAGNPAAPSFFMVADSDMVLTVDYFKGTTKLNP